MDVEGQMCIRKLCVAKPSSSLQMLKVQRPFCRFYESSMYLQLKKVHIQIHNNGRANYNITKSINIKRMLQFSPLNIVL